MLFEEAIKIVDEPTFRDFLEDGCEVDVHFSNLEHEGLFESIVFEMRQRYRTNTGLPLYIAAIGQQDGAHVVRFRLRPYGQPKS